MLSSPGHISPFEFWIPLMRFLQNSCETILWKYPAFLSLDIIQWTFGFLVPHFFFFHKQIVQLIFQLHHMVYTSPLDCQFFSLPQTFFLLSQNMCYISKRILTPPFKFFWKIFNLFNTRFMGDLTVSSLHGKVTISW